MNSSGRATRVIRSSAAPATPMEDVFVLSESTRLSVPAVGTLATAAAVMAAAERRAGDLVLAAENRASALVALAERQAEDVRDEAIAEGHAIGRAAAEAEVAQCLSLIRHAAAEGKAVRDGVAAQAAAVVARAASLATRRIVADYYESDPARTAAAVADALRAASGQDVIAIRVHPQLADAVSASLAPSAAYVQPDAAVAIGGCIIDLRLGTLDATLDARLSMLELALAEVGGELS